MKTDEKYIGTIIEIKKEEELERLYARSRRDYVKIIEYINEIKEDIGNETNEQMITEMNQNLKYANETLKVMLKSALYEITTTEKGEIKEEKLIKQLSEIIGGNNERNI